MIFASVCSGIEAPSVAWHPLGWRAAFYSEIDKFPSAVLAHHYPNTPNLGDMNGFHDWPESTVDLLVGGTPCQSFSVAGLRRGLDDPRGNLSLVYLGLVDRLRPRWIVWENVPGVLSVDGGRAFGAFLGGLVQLGYGFAYRVLDAQFFGVPQRRRRVFVVGHSGDWRRAAAVLFEPSCLRRDSPPSGEAREGVAGSIDARAGRGFNGQDAHSDKLIAHSLRADGFDASEDGTGRGTPLVFDPTQITHPANRSRDLSLSPSISESAHPPTIAFDWNNSAGAPNSEETFGTISTERSMAVAFSWQSGGDARGLDPRETAQLQREQTPALLSRQIVRRLTPRECERLQGFPDDYTLIPYRGKPTADGPRYKALGNSMAVPVVRWLGEQIAALEMALAERGAA